MFIAIQHHNSRTIPKALEIDEPFVCDKFSECHITAYAVANRIVDCVGWREIIAPWNRAWVSALLPNGHSVDGDCAIEQQHHTLAARVSSFGVPVIQACFLENAEEVEGNDKFSRIVMNPHSPRSANISRLPRRFLEETVSTFALCRSPLNMKTRRRLRHCQKTRFRRGPSRPKSLGSCIRAERRILHQLRHHLSSDICRLPSPKVAIRNELCIAVFFSPLK